MIGGDAIPPRDIPIEGKNRISPSATPHNRDER
jgi:hypothetical protein